MAAAAPAKLSGLAKLLLRRPPSLRDLVTLIGYADDYAWFVGLVRRLFPQEAEAALAAPDVRGRVERFAGLSGERHFPLYTPFIEFWTKEEGEQPPWSWLRQGIPFDLMGASPSPQPRPPPSGRRSLEQQQDADPVGTRLGREVRGRSSPQVRRHSVRATMYAALFAFQTGRVPVYAALFAVRSPDAASPLLGRGSRILTIHVCSLIFSL